MCSVRPLARALLVGNPRVFFRSPRRSCRSLSVLASAHRRRNPTPDLPSSQSGRKRTPWKLSARARRRLAAPPRRRSADATPLPPPPSARDPADPPEKNPRRRNARRWRRRASCRPSAPSKTRTNYPRRAMSAGTAPLTTITRFCTARGATWRCISCATASSACPPETGSAERANATASPRARARRRSDAACARWKVARSSPRPGTGGRTSSVRTGCRRRTSRT